jgi:hypothetical protein
MNRPMQAPTVPTAAYMLADHLDAALAAGEDIIAAGQRMQPDGVDTPCGGVALRTGVELIRSLELALITRVLKAREWSKSLDKADSRFRMIGSLFQGGTVSFVEALAEFADATEADFQTGDGVTAYFRSRGIIDAETPSLQAHIGPLVSETFRVTGRIELGPLLDLLASYLDALETQFVLFNGLDVPNPASASATSASASAH